MIDVLNHLAPEIRSATFGLLHRYMADEKPFLLRSDLADGLTAVAESESGRRLAGSVIEQLVDQAQEAAFNPPWVIFAVRPRTGRWLFIRTHCDTLVFEEVSASEYLAFKERLVNGVPCESAWPLEIDFRPFSRHFPRLRESRSIGRGGEFLNRRLAGQLFADSEHGLQQLFRFLSLHTCQGQQLMINESVASVEELRRAARTAIRALGDCDPENSWADVCDRLRALGFEIGWGHQVFRIRESLEILQEVLEAPDPATFEALLARIPMMFRVAIVSPHGFFGQTGVMGLPDTGGQVVYILDQVRALEREMEARLKDQGLTFEPQIAVITRLIPESRGATADQKLEPIAGTKNARILRVPFRSADGTVVPHWIPRFSVWPYLERFAVEAEKEILAELGGRPDLIIGNYSDGNLVSTLLAQRLEVTHCTIAHALEKSKYLFSDLYWKNNEEPYHFSCQFLADLISMNAADFIITSTYQEVAGDETGVGQYESYASFTMPGLVRVLQGIDVFDPRFNIVSPGVDPETYFSYADRDRRLAGVVPEIKELLFSLDAEDTRGNFRDPDRPILLSMARMDRIKNLTGLAQMFGENERLREIANLVIVGGVIDADRSSDSEERQEIMRMHRLMDELELGGSVRWVGRLLSKPVAGELYRLVADGHGVFVQPALFEAFGLTVVEAMSSGLPTFATQYGGPSEIIQHGVSGFHIDPNRGDATADLIADFLERCSRDESCWIEVSEAALERVRSRYTWKLYAERLMTMARVYGFWRYLTSIERSETNTYLQALYDLKYRPLALSLDE